MNNNLARERGFRGNRLILSAGTIVKASFIERVNAASNFGQQHHSAWSYNLMANPNATMELEGKIIPVTAVRLTDQEKEAIWDTLVANVPNYAVYKSRTDRNFQVYRLVQSVT